MRAASILAIAFLCAGLAGSQADAQQAAPKPAAKSGTLDLSTPEHVSRRVVTHGDPLRAPGGQNRVEFGRTDFGRLDLGGSELHFDGSRDTRDPAREVSGFDTTPGSSSFRQLAPAQKTGTPSYFGFTLRRPN